MNCLGKLVAVTSVLAVSPYAASQQAPLETTQQTVPAREPLDVGDQRDITIRTVLTPPPQLACQAELEMSWYQKGPRIRVESELINADCDASSGTYTVEVRYRGDTPEVLRKEFPESWARPDDQPIQVEKEYEIAENVDVIRVRVRKLRCQCAVEEAPADEPPAAE